jgi:hypothetical protein
MLFGSGKNFEIIKRVGSCFSSEKNRALNWDDSKANPYVHAWGKDAILCPTVKNSTVEPKNAKNEYMFVFSENIESAHGSEANKGLYDTKKLRIQTSLKIKKFFENIFTQLIQKRPNRGLGHYSPRFAKIPQF